MEIRKRLTLQVNPRYVLVRLLQGLPRQLATLLLPPRHEAVLSFIVHVKPSEVEAISAWDSVEETGGPPRMSREPRVPSPSSNREKRNRKIKALTQLRSPLADS